MKKIIGFFTIILAMAFTAAAQDTTSKEMVGKYKFPTGSVIEEAIVTWENGVLTMSSTAGVSVLEKMKGDTFNVVSFNGICIFKRDDAKKVSGVHVDASGYILDGEKETPRLADYSSATPGNTAKQHQLLHELLLCRIANPPCQQRIYN